MKRFHYQLAVDLTDHDADLKSAVPGIIRDRFKGSAVKVMWIGGPYGEDDGEAGEHEPRRDSPDSGAPGEARLPGGSDDYLPIEIDPDDPRREINLACC